MAPVRSLQRKLLRDLLRLKGQILTIALVVAAGIAAHVALEGNYASLVRARDAFYSDQRFANVFAGLERAPLGVRAELETLPGVEAAAVRVVKPVTITLPDVPVPIRARVIGLSSRPSEEINAVRLIQGRLPESGRLDEALVLHGFATARGLHIGDSLPVIVNGTLRRMRIAGTVMSPEYVLAVGGGAISADPERFAVLWMDETVVRSAFRMEGAFNDVSIRVMPGASTPGVISAVDRLLSPYGGLGAGDRSRQASAHVIEGELLQLRGMSTVLPIIFLGVAALLVNVVLSRLVLLQQGEIATLKAIGYSNREIAGHFIKFVLVVVALGLSTGIGVGGWLGIKMIALYADFFKFPDLVFTPRVQDAMTASAISFAAALLGAWGALRRITHMSPAEAMQPPAPAVYRRSFVDNLGLGAWLGPSAQMVVRELQRRPLRLILSVVAIASSTALSVVGGWYYDGIETLVETQFFSVMREDASVAFLRPMPGRAVRELGHVEGVRRAEGLRMVPVRFHAGQASRYGAIVGYSEDSTLRSVRDMRAQPHALSPSGVTLTETLADILHVRPGETVDVDVLEGRRAHLRLTVTGTVNEPFGLQGHMLASALDDALGEESSFSMALLETDPLLRPQVQERLKAMPSVAEVINRVALLQRFRDQSGKMMNIMALVVSLFAATITVGVVYNNARISLSTRARDLASLRVLGFTRREVSSVLLGELALQVLLAVPIGLLLGHPLVAMLASTADPETYRIPVVLTAKSFGLAALVTLLAALASALLVRRRIDQLDLIGVLKTKE